MAKRRRDQVDQGRGYFETSSPFETFEPAQNRGKPRTFTGLVDHQPIGDLKEHLSGPSILNRLDPEQYDNPRGFPGLAMVTAGDQTSKLPLPGRDKGHSIMHHMEMQGNLADTANRGGRRKRGT